MSAEPLSREERGAIQRSPYITGRDAAVSAFSSYEATVQAVEAERDSERARAEGYADLLHEAYGVWSGGDPVEADEVFDRIDAALAADDAARGDAVTSTLTSRDETPLVHLSMVYACDAGHERRIYCGYGVEGPPALKADERAWAEHRIICSPFIGGDCPECGATARHVRWSEDELFEPMIPAPPGATVWVHPGAEVARRRKVIYGGSVFLGDTVQVPAGDAARGEA